MRTLLVDLENSANIGDVWSLWNTNVSLSQLRESARVFAFGAKWLDDGKPVRFYSEYDFKTRERVGNRAMLEKAWELYDQADAVITYNGDGHDHPHFKREWLEAGMPPPSPFKSIDLCRVVKKEFKFPSNKLDYVAGRLLGEHKVSHAGHRLWRECLDPDVDPTVRHRAWVTMRKYCKQDVALMEPLYHKLLPWIGSHPAVGLYSDDLDGCPRCGADALQRRGFAYTALSRYQRYVCTACGGWSRGKRADIAVDVRGTK